MDHAQRRWMLYQAVERLEPNACLTVIRNHLARHHGLELPLLRLSVDLERLVSEGHLARRHGPHPSGTGTAFFYETLGAVLVEPPCPRAKVAAAMVPLPPPPEKPSPVQHLHAAMETAR